MTKMIDMSRDPEQLSEMVSSYDPEYPIGFFLDPRMVSELGLKDAQAGDEFKIVGTIKVKSLTKTTEKKELYVSVKELGIEGKAKETATDKMTQTYGDENGD